MIFLEITKNKWILSHEWGFTRLTQKSLWFKFTPQEMRISWVFQWTNPEKHPPQHVAGGSTCAVPRPSLDNPMSPSESDGKVRWGWILDILWMNYGYIKWISIYIYMDLSMFVRYVWAFRTRVLKTRVPERAFWVNPFFQWYKVNLFPGFEQRNPCPSLKKGCGALVGSKWCMKPPESWSSQLRILFGWGKKGSGLTRLVGQVRFPSRILFSLKENGPDPSQILS